MKYTLDEIKEIAVADRIAIVSNGPSIARRNPEFDDPNVTGLTSKMSIMDTSHIDCPVWTLNGGWTYHPHSVLGFDMHDVKDKVWAEQYEGSDQEYKEWWDWFKKNHDEATIPIFSCYEYPDWPNLTAYPLEEVVKFHNFAYFAETANYMIALAIMWGVKEIDLYGTDYSDHHEYPDERASNEFWLGVAHGHGVKINTSPYTNLLKPRTPAPHWQEGFYGYHQGRLPIKLKYEAA